MCSRLYPGWHVLILDFCINEVRITDYCGTFKNFRTDRFIVLLYEFNIFLKVIFIFCFIAEGQERGDSSAGEAAGREDTEDTAAGARHGGHQEDAGCERRGGQGKN